MKAARANNKYWDNTPPPPQTKTHKARLRCPQRRPALLRGKTHDIMSIQREMTCSDRFNSAEDTYLSYAALMSPIPSTANGPAAPHSSPGRKFFVGSVLQQGPGEEFGARSGGRWGDAV